VALHDETVTVHRVTNGRPNDDGVATPTSTPVDVDGCNVQPAASTEDIANNEPSVERLRVSTSEPCDWIRARDTVTWRGDTYRVLGKPQTFWATIPHTEFIIVDVKG
jgi:hypothetical protein